ncbi:MAG: hypothetical protein V2A73_07325 [Pseudomonadota bacterium]
MASERQASEERYRRTDFPRPSETRNAVTMVVNGNTYYAATLLPANRTDGAGRRFEEA